MLLPKLEAAKATMDSLDSGLSAEFIIENLVSEQGFRGEVARKIIAYQSKERAIQDCI